MLVDEARQGEEIEPNENIRYINKDVRVQIELDLDLC